MKASDLLVRSLEQESVEYFVGVPREENLDFLESLRGSKISPILTRHDQNKLGDFECPNPMKSR